jgi:hypothetical protein
LFVFFANDHDRTAIARRAVQIGHQFILGNQQLRRYQIDAISQLALRQPPVQACRDHAEIGRRQFDLKIFRPVAREQCHAVAAHQSVTGQYGGHALDPIQQLAIADAAIAIFDGKRGLLNPCAGTKQVADCRQGPCHRRWRIVVLAYHQVSSSTALFVVLRSAMMPRKPETIFEDKQV